MLQLDDLIIALRTVEAARNGGISCSIDPTAEGRQRLEQFLNQQQVFSPAVVQGVEQALGLQQITLTGVPEDSRFARMLVAADYRMKRYGMKLEAAPVGSKDLAMAAVQQIINFKVAAERGIQAGQIKSIIHPALADHVRREAVRFKDELERAV